MPPLGEYHGNKFIKILYVGNSSAGKTSSLISLLRDGYRIRVLDLDEGLISLRGLIEHEFPEKLSDGSIDYVTCRDVFKAGPNGPVIKGQPHAFTDALKFMDKWEDGSIPSEWGDKTVFVLDSLTMFGAAAYDFANNLNPTSKDKRQVYNAAQTACRHVINTLTGEAFRTNVIVITHIDYKKNTEGEIIGAVPSSIGTALGEKLGVPFSTIIECAVSGAGKNIRREIKTVPDGYLGLKNPVPFKLAGTLPQGTGLSTLFKTLKGQNTNA